MPVEAADIGKTTMDIGDAASTGCEQTAMESDERVSKKTARASEARFPTKSTW
jgi:hypothetical protein